MEECILARAGIGSQRRMRDRTAALPDSAAPTESSVPRGTPLLAFIICLDYVRSRGSVTAV